MSGIFMVLFNSTPAPIAVVSVFGSLSAEPLADVGFAG